MYFLGTFPVVKTPLFQCKRCGFGQGTKISHVMQRGKKIFFKNLNVYVYVHIYVCVCIFLIFGFQLFGDLFFLSENRKNFQNSLVCAMGPPWIALADPKWGYGENTRRKQLSLFCSKAVGSMCYCSVTKSCPALCNPVDCSTAGSSVLHCLHEVCSNLCPSSQWCHPTISSSVVPFSCLQSFPASGSFPTSCLFTSGGQSIGTSASVLPVNIQGLISFRIDWFDLLAVQSTFKSLCVQIYLF